MSVTDNSYLETLKEKYRSALKAERDALIALEHARRRKTIYAGTLAEEGIDAASLASHTNGSYTIRIGSSVTSTGLFTSPDEGPENGPKRIEPLSDTHALYIIMRKHGNVGFTFDELKKYADVEGYDLTPEAIKNTFWKQHNSGRMERLPDNKIRLTKEGEVFNKFRPPKA